MAVNPKPPILWVRGSHDMICSDNSMFDLGALGKLGYVPGWPGEDVFPPQPMVSQTRFMLEKFAAAGGQFKEVIVEDTAHSPHIEKPAEFLAVFLSFMMR
jgi:pimeloyl-ACP methyl ester carboxylesterase